jgi:hypothetical protein
LAEGLAEVLEYDQERIGPDRLNVARSARERILGTDLRDRLAALLATPPWDLSADAYREHPQVLVDIAGELLVADNTEALLRETLSLPDTQPQTRYVFGVIVAVNDESRALEHLVDDESVDLEFRAGYLRGLAQEAGDKADTHIRAWMEHGWFDEAIYVLSVLSATPERASLAVEATGRADEAGAPTSALQRMAFGSWLVPLESDAATLVIRRLVEDAERDGSFGAVDAAAFALWSYLAKHELTPTLRELGQRALPLTEQHSGGRGRDLSYIRNQIADQIGEDPRERLQATLRALGRTGLPRTEDMKAIRNVLPQLGETAINEVFDWLLAQDFAVTLYVRDASIVSLMSEVFGEQPVVEALQQRPTTDQAQLLQHLNFKEDIPSIAEQLLVQTDDGTVEEELSRHFLYPGEVVMGPYSEYLSRRRQLLERRTRGGSPERVRRWAAQLLPRDGPHDRR